MTTPADREIREIRADIAEVLVRYATGIDSRDWDLFRTCFTDDCDADYGPIGHWHGADEITEWMRRSHEPAGHTMHRITNQVVEPEPGGDGDGDRSGKARARSYVDALILSADNRSGTRAAGYYDDDLVHTGDGWKIGCRRFTMVLLQSVPDGTIIDL